MDHAVSLSSDKFDIKDLIWRILIGWGRLRLVKVEGALGLNNRVSHEDKCEIQVKMENFNVALICIPSTYAPFMQVHVFCAHIFERHSNKWMAATIAHHISSIVTIIHGRCFAILFFFRRKWNFTAEKQIHRFVGNIPRRWHSMSQLLDIVLD